MSVKLNGILVGNEAYPNNERIYRDISKNIIDNDSRVELFVQYESAVDFENMLMVGSYVNYMRPQECVLNLWYVPYLRMDRHVGDRDPMIHGLLSIMNTVFRDWRIVTLDPHVDLSEYGHYEYLPVNAFIQHVMERENIDVICYPDEGARKRYGKIGDTPITYAEKMRDIETGKISHVMLKDEQGYNGLNVLIIDDICSYGGTSNAVAKQLKEAGASKVTAWYSHTEMNIYKGTLLKDGYIDKVYTSNSIMDCGIVPGIIFLTMKNGVVEPVQ